MSAITYYVALPFSRNEDGDIIAGTASECVSASSATNTAKRLAARDAGAIAFSRSGDPAIGEFADAVVLQTFGEVLSLDELIDAQR